MNVDTYIEVLSLYYMNMLASTIIIRCDHLVSLYGNSHKNIHTVDKTIIS